MHFQFHIKTLLVVTTIVAAISVIAKFLFEDPHFLWLTVMYVFCLFVYLLFVAGHRFRGGSRQAEIEARREKILREERTKIEIVKEDSRPTVADQGPMRKSDSQDPDS